MSYEDMVKKLEMVQSIEELRFIFVDLRVFASNNRSSEESIQLIQSAIKKSTFLNDKKTLVNLYGLKILQFYHLNDKLTVVSKTIEKTHNLAERIKYTDGLALCFTYKWYIEKFQGDKISAKRAKERAIALLNSSSKHDPYIYHFCRYAFSVDQWLEEHDPTSIQIFEDCLNYFYHNKFYRSLAQTLGMLSVIYMRTQDNKKALETSIKILSNKSLFNKMPDDVKGIVYYFTGLTHLLNSNLSLAESSFTDAYDILKPVSEKSIYFSYFITLCAYFSSVKALQGKIIQAFEMINEVDKLLKKEFYIKNLDKNTESQILHTLNLIKSTYIHAK